MDLRETDFMRARSEYGFRMRRTGGIIPGCLDRDFGIYCFRLWSIVVDASIRRYAQTL